MVNKMLGRHWADVRVQESSYKGKTGHCIPKNDEQVLRMKGGTNSHIEDE